MNESFYLNIITLLKKSDVRFRETEVRPVNYCEDGTRVSMFFSEHFNMGPTELSKTPAISCLIVFTLFDAYLENKYDIQPGVSFKQKYNRLPYATNQNIIEKECYRLMKTIRNGFVHNISAITSTDDLFHFNYTSPLRTVFNLDISSDKLELLYSIILLLVKDKYEVNTKGHFENVICTMYNDLKEYVDMSGNFTDDCGSGEGADVSFNLIAISSDLHFNTAVRYPVKNPTYEISDDGRVIIKSIYDPGYASYSADYCIEHNDKKYIIPQEILDEENSTYTSVLPKWELN